MCNSCPKEVEWQKMSFQPLLSIMQSINVQRDASLIVPDHLYTDGIIQYYIIITFKNDISTDKIYNALEESSIDWNSIDFNKKIIWGGSIFKIPDKKGYWILRAPCLKCYCNIVNQTENLQILNRCFIQSFL